MTGSFNLDGYIVDKSAGADDYTKNVAVNNVPVYGTHSTTSGPAASVKQNVLTMPQVFNQCASMKNALLKVLLILDNEVVGTTPKKSSAHSQYFTAGELSSYVNPGPITQSHLQSFINILTSTDCQVPGSDACKNKFKNQGGVTAHLQHLYVYARHNHNDGDSYTADRTNLLFVGNTCNALFFKFTGVFDNRCSVATGEQ